MNRLTNWPRLFAEFLDSRRETHFAWGTHDCCIFAADAIQAISGVDLAERYRGYDSKEEARVILHAHGGVAGVTVLAEHLPEVAPKRAKRGDLVLIRGHFGDTLGVLGLNSYPVAPKRIGWRSVDRERILRAWSVG